MASNGMVLLMCAGLLLSGGAILGGSTSWNLLRMSYYFWTTDLGVELGSAALLVAGALLCLPACWVATLVPYHPRSQSLAATLMFLSTAALLLLSTGVSSLGALSRAVREPGALNASMLRALTHEPFNPAVRSAFASMQLEMKCCGVQSYTDWYAHRRTLPPSCCNRVWNAKGKELCDTPAFPGGCLRGALLELRAFANSACALAAAIIVVLSVTVFAAAYSVANGVVERGEGRLAKPAPARLTCTHSLPPPAHIVALTAPAAMPIAPPTTRQM